MHTPSRSYKRINMSETLAHEGAAARTKVDEPSYYQRLDDLHPVSWTQTNPRVMFPRRSPKRVRAESDGRPQRYCQAGTMSAARSRLSADCRMMRRSRIG